MCSFGSPRTVRPTGHDRGLTGHGLIPLSSKPAPLSCAHIRQACVQSRTLPPRRIRLAARPCARRSRGCRAARCSSPRKASSRSRSRRSVRFCCIASSSRWNIGSRPPRKNTAGSSRCSRGGRKLRPPPRAQVLARCPMRLHRAGRHHGRHPNPGSRNIAAGRTSVEVSVERKPLLSPVAPRVA